MNIKSMIVGFEVPSVDLKSDLHRSDYEDLLKDIFNAYPIEVETLDSSLEVIPRESSKYIVYNYLAEFDEEKLSSKATDKLLNEFKKLISSSIEKYLQKLGIPYKIL